MTPAAHGPILVPVDFSAASQAAFDHAVALAAATGREVHVVHVVHEPSDHPGYYREAADEMSRGLRTLSELAEVAFVRFIDDACEQNPSAPAAADVARTLVKGVPATRIIEVAEQLEASQIVMGSSGRTGLSHLLLGSQAERVVRLAPVPVTIVKAPADDSDAS